MIGYSKPVGGSPPTFESNYWMTGSGSSFQHGQPLYYAPGVYSEVIPSSPPQGNWNLQGHPFRPQFGSPTPVQYGGSAMTVEHEPYEYGFSCLPSVSYVLVPTVTQMPQDGNKVCYVSPAPCAPLTPANRFEGSWTNPNFTGSSCSSSLSVDAQPFHPANPNTHQGLPFYDTGIVVPETGAVRSTSRRTSATQEILNCCFCRNNGETKEFYRTHNLKNEDGTVQCPVLRKHSCPLCHARGDNAHTIKYCPENNGQIVTSVGSIRRGRKPRRNSTGFYRRCQYIKAT